MQQQANSDNWQWVDPFRGWAYWLAMWVLNGPMRRTDHRRRAERMVRQALRRYRVPAERPASVIKANGDSLALFCLLSFGWRVRKNRQTRDYIIESN